jgi:hypothetical protein
MITDVAHIGVAVQTVDPPMPATSLLDEFDSNGLVWRVYDIGPANGSVVTAISEVDDRTVLISAQAWTFYPTTLPPRLRRADRPLRSSREPMKRSAAHTSAAPAPVARCTGPGIRERLVRPSTGEATARRPGVLEDRE